MSSPATMMEPSLLSWSSSLNLECLELGRSHSSLSTTVKYWRIPVDTVRERTSEQVVVRVELRYTSLNACGKSGRDHITVIILFYLMHITCATIVASRGLESTAGCWTVWTGRRKVSGGRSVDSGGRAWPLLTSVRRTLYILSNSIETIADPLPYTRVWLRQTNSLTLIYTASGHTCRELLTDHFCLTFGPLAHSTTMFAPMKSRPCSPRMAS